MKAEDRGAVAVMSGSHRLLTHLVKEDLSATLCGRYKIDRIEPEGLELAESTKECQVCQAIANKTNDYRWRGRR
jgi:hypothetical protein